MKKLVGLATLGLTGGVTAGLVAMTAPAAADMQAAVLRKDDLAQVVMTVDDDDDDDDTTRGGSTTVGTGSSRSRRDWTNSRYSPLSRDRDVSRGDKTRDFTWDGGDRTRDFSRNATNDRSRNDTRRGRLA